jgi:hypothetical protein
LIAHGGTHSSPTRAPVGRLVRRGGIARGYP